VNVRRPETRSVRPEPVEGLSFPLASVEREGQGFDKLSPNGVGLVCIHLFPSGSNS
jgi:hypothetical protein